MRLGRHAAAAAVGFMALSIQATAQSADLVVLTSQGSESGLRQIAAGFEKATGHKVTFSTMAKEKLDSADLIAPNSEGMEALVKSGKVVAGTVTPFGLAGLGVSVRAGAPRPDIGTVETFKAALIAAKSVGYSRGCSGSHTAAGIAELGIADQLKAKTVLTDGGPVAQFLAKGDFEIGIQQTNVLVGMPGTDYVGPLPGFLNKPCRFSAGLLANSKQETLALAMLKYMTMPEAGEWVRKGYMDPITP